MAANGSTVKVYAKNYQGCLNAEANVVCTDQLMEQGYASLLRDLAPYGLMPNEKDVYWETPYSTYAQDKYSYAEAARQAQLGQRSYEICKEGEGDRKSTRLNSSHSQISYAVFCLKKKKKTT